MAKPLNLHPALLLLKKIPKGKVTTYGILSRACNSSPRAIGQIMRRNPYPEVCPCYKVIRSDGSIGGYAGKIKGKKLREKIERLRRDGVIIKDGKIDKKYFCDFK